MLHQALVKLLVVRHGITEQVMMKKYTEHSNNALKRRLLDNYMNNCPIKRRLSINYGTVIGTVKEFVRQLQYVREPEKLSVY